MARAATRTRRRSRLAALRNALQRLGGSDRALDRLLRSEDRLNTIVTGSRGILYISELGPEGRWTYVSPQVEEILGHTHGVAMSNAITGYSMLTQTYATYSGLFFVSLEPWHDRHGAEAGVKQIVASLNRRFASIPEARIFAFLPPAIPGFGTASGFSFMLQDRSGGPVEYLAQNVDRFLER